MAASRDHEPLPAGDVGDLEARRLGVPDHAVDGAELLGEVALLADREEAGPRADDDERAHRAEGETEPAPDAQVGQAMRTHERNSWKGRADPWL